MLKGAINLGNPVSNSPLNRGLVGWWLALPQKMGGGRFLDLTGKYPATLVSSPQWLSAAGRPGGYGSIGRTSNGTDTMSLAVTPPALTDLTIAFWFKYSVVNFYRVFAPQWRSVTGGRQIGFEPSTSSGNLTAAYYFGYTLYSGSAITADVWGHYVITRRGNAIAMYQNGVSTHSTTGADTTATSGDLGVAFGPGTSLAQTIQSFDDIRIMSRGMSSDEAFALYNDSRTGYQQTLNRLPMRVYGTAAAAASGNRRRRVIC